METSQLALEDVHTSALPNEVAEGDEVVEG
jgi:hypothetical protein